MESEVIESESKQMEKYLFALFVADKAAPIRGRIRLVKQVFLMAKQVQPELARIMRFFPYLYGPYSNPVAEAINGLIDGGYIRTYKDDGEYVYELTEKGQQTGRERVADIPEETMQKIVRLKKTTQELSIRELLKLVYRTYPEYAVYSKGREVYGTS